MTGFVDHLISDFSMILIYDIFHEFTHPHAPAPASGVEMQMAAPGGVEHPPRAATVV